MIALRNILCTAMACVYACAAQAQHKYTLGFDYQTGTNNFNNSITSYGYVLDYPYGYVELPNVYAQKPWKYDYSTDRNPTNATNLRLKLEVAKPNNISNKYTLGYNHRYRSERYLLKPTYWVANTLSIYKIIHEESEMMATMGKIKEFQVFDLNKLHLKFGVDIGIGGAWGGVSNSLTQLADTLVSFTTDTIRSGNNIDIKFVDVRFGVSGKSFETVPHLNFMVSFPLSIEFDITKRFGVSATLTKSYFTTAYFKGLTDFDPYISKKTRQNQVMFGFGAYYRFNGLKKS